MLHRANHKRCLQCVMQEFTSVYRKLFILSFYRSFPSVQCSLVFNEHGDFLKLLRIPVLGITRGILYFALSRNKEKIVHTYPMEALCGFPRVICIGFGFMAPAFSRSRCLIVISEPARALTIKGTLKGNFISPLWLQEPGVSSCVILLVHAERKTLQMSPYRC